MSEVKFESKTFGEVKVRAFFDDGSDTHPDFAMGHGLDIFVEGEHIGECYGYCLVKEDEIDFIDFKREIEIWILNNH